MQNKAPAWVAFTMLWLPQAPRVLLSLPRVHRGVCNLHTHTHLIEPRRVVPAVAVESTEAFESEVELHARVLAGARQPELQAHRGVRRRDVDVLA